MKKIRKMRKGFTLIELLIVIVILAVLAALVLPRMLAQPERAVVAEAIQYLGVIRRAQLNNSPGSVLQFSALSSGNNSNWTALGLQDLSAETAYSYACNATGCTAERLTGGKAGARVMIDIPSGNLTCGGANATGNYTLVGTGKSMSCA
jgi:prepilin-type N-terminal cleavage/methylation domain-containing protein